MKVKFNYKYFIFILLLASLTLAGLCGIVFIKKITVGSEALDAFEKVIVICISLLLFVVSGTSLFKILHHGLLYKYCFTIDENGISNALVPYGLLFFFVIGSVKNIPWNTISSVSIEKRMLCKMARAEINNKYLNEIDASAAAKFFISNYGFYFGRGLEKAKPSELVSICEKYMKNNGD